MELKGGSCAKTPGLKPILLTQPNSLLAASSLGFQIYSFPSLVVFFGSRGIHHARKKKKEVTRYPTALIINIPPPTTPSGIRSQTTIESLDLVVTVLVDGDFSRSPLLESALTEAWSETPGAVASSLKDTSKVIQRLETSFRQL